jgi:hypothetical protein
MRKRVRPGGTESANGHVAERAQMRVRVRSKPLAPASGLFAELRAAGSGLAADGS